MKDILIIAHFTQVPGEKRNNRLHYIAEKLAEDEAVNIEVVTSNFSHGKKKHIFISDETMNKSNYKLTMVDEPGYRKNVSLKRIYSHYIAGKNLEKYLKDRKKPDVIYCSVPSLNFAEAAVNYSKKNNIKLIIDVLDLWPEAFQMVFDIPNVSDMLFKPMKDKADYIYKSANEIVAVSETYAQRALNASDTLNEASIVFLGTDLEQFDKAMIENKTLEKNENEIRIAYAGTLGHSYDLISVFDALEILNKMGYGNLKFIVMGDGPLKEKFEEYSEKQKINTVFTGRLPYNEMVGVLGDCDIAVNPIRKKSAGSIINKHADYSAAGLPILNTQESLEYRKLISEYKAGLNCKPEDPVDLAKKILVLISDDTLRAKMAKNSRKLAEEKFDRNRTYSKIIKLIEEWPN